MDQQTSEPGDAVSSSPPPGYVDPRGPRAGAAVTSVVLAVVVLTGSTALLAVQAVVFALGAVGGPSASPYGWAWKRLVRPRLGPPTELESAAPLRFAQVVGLVFALVGVAGGAAGSAPVLLGAAALALVAALLNAAFGLCLGCEAYLTVRRGQRAASLIPVRRPAADNRTGAATAQEASAA